jgi:hypothetical protein
MLPALVWAFQLQLAGCRPIEVDVGPLVVKLKFLSMEVIDIKSYK